MGKFHFSRRANTSALFLVFRRIAPNFSVGKDAMVYIMDVEPVCVIFADSVAQPHLCGAMDRDDFRVKLFRLDRTMSEFDLLSDCWCSYHNSACFFPSVGLDDTNRQRRLAYDLHGYARLVNHLLKRLAVEV